MSGRIAFFLYGLSGGGVPRRTVTLANAFAARGDAVDLVVLDSGNPWRLPLSPAVRPVSVGVWSARLPLVRAKRRRQFALCRRALARYLARERPAALIAADNYANLTALEARRDAGVAVPVIVTQRTHTSSYAARKPELIDRIRRTYPQADAVVGVSRAIVEDLVAIGVPREITHTIHNPVIPEDFDAIAASPVEHPWFRAGQPPVILGVGRIGPQKDFATLVRAFALVRQSDPAVRLVILGDAVKPADRETLLGLADGLGVRHAVDLPGAVPQAIPYMARAQIFALSSRWEGMPGVLIEAMACGTPVVSTDCPSGPDEVLEDGRYGMLVPVGDHDALGRAMLEALRRPVDGQALRARGRRFSARRALENYSRLIDSLVTRRSRSTEMTFPSANS